MCIDPSPLHCHLGPRPAHSDSARARLRFAYHRYIASTMPRPYGSKDSTQLIDDETLAPLVKFNFSHLEINSAVFDQLLAAGIDDEVIGRFESFYSYLLGNKVRVNGAQMLSALKQYIRGDQEKMKKFANVIAQGMTFLKKKVRSTSSGVKVSAAVGRLIIQYKTNCEEGNAPDSKAKSPAQSPSLPTIDTKNASPQKVKILKRNISEELKADLQKSKSMWNIDVTPKKAKVSTCVATPLTITSSPAISQVWDQSEHAHCCDLRLCLSAWGRGGLNI